MEQNSTIKTKAIRKTHKKIKEIVKEYAEINLQVATITAKVNENWVGKGHDEFQNQHRIWLRKIEDFGDTLKDLYDALVETEASYIETDEKIGNKLPSDG